MTVCECCLLEPALDKPVAFPKVPMVFRLCQTCQAVGLIPYDLLVTFVWLGELSIDDPWVRAVAIFHGSSSAVFEDDCANFAEKMQEAFEDEV